MSDSGIQNPTHMSVGEQNFQPTQFELEATRNCSRSRMKALHFKFIFEGPYSLMSWQ